MRVKMFLAVAVMGACMSVSPAANAQHQPVNEGGDYQHCVTEAELKAALLYMPERRIARVFDTRGHRVSPERLDAVLDLVNESVGSRNYVRVYHYCDETPEVPDKIYIEFSTNTAMHRALTIATM